MASSTLVEPRRPMTVRDAMMHMTGLRLGRTRHAVRDRDAPSAEPATPCATAIAQPARRGLDTRDADGALAERAAALPSRRALVLLGVDRRVRRASSRSSRASGSTTTCDEHDLRAARHGRHRRSRSRTTRSTASPRATDAARDKSTAARRRPARERIPQAAHVPVGRRRPGRRRPPTTCASRRCSATAASSTASASSAARRSS